MTMTQFQLARKTGKYRIRLIRGYFALLLVGQAQATTLAATENDGDNATVNYMIVVTGSELLTGVYADGHTHFLTRTLHPLGLRCVGSMSVDDKEDDITAAVRFATARARLVIVTGGLGPTDNDITRETLADITDIPLQEHPDVLTAMEKRFRTPRDRLRTNLRRQTQVPSHGTYLENRTGSAVGLIFESDDAVVVALPGPPRELQPMVQDQLVPYLSARFGTRLPGSSLTVRFVGIGQSGIDETLDRHVQLPKDVAIATQFDGMRVDFTFTMPDDSAGSQRRLEELEQSILKHLSPYIYATDTTSLEEQVVESLKARSETLVLIECGTGGALAATLATAAQADSVVAAAYVAPKMSSLRALLEIPKSVWSDLADGAAQAERLAIAGMSSSHASWAIVVGDVRPADGNKRSVSVTIKCVNGRSITKTHGFGGRDSSNRARLITHLLDQFRRDLQTRR